MKTAGKKKQYTITEAAKELGVSRAAVHRAIKRGRLEATRGTFEVVRTVTVKKKGWQIAADDLQRFRVSELHQWVGKK